MKAQLLSPQLRAQNTWDDMLQQIGLGVAQQFETYCNRKFARVANDQQILSADRVEFLLPRYPVESVSLVELKLTEKDGWQQLDAPPWQNLQTIDLVTGIVRFPESDDVGPYYAQVRFTFTGGYWWAQLDQGEAGYPDVQPAGSNPIPNDLKFAWTLQCRKVWEAIDKTGAKLVTVGSNARNPMEVMAGLDIVPQAQKVLNNYIRSTLIS
ncbi:MAG TPA: hypothetical protein VF988_03660 [Verrucomicrobiae bacterium]